MSKFRTSEHAEQSSLITWCRLHEYKHPELSMLFAIPNGGHRHIAVAHKMKKEGVRSGVPDLFLPVARGDYHGLFIEMKVVGGRPSKNQAVWIANLTEQGHHAGTVLCRHILRYLLPPRGEHHLPFLREPSKAGLEGPLRPGCH